MTKQEYEQVIEIIDRNMTILREGNYLPRIVLTQYGFANAKKELKEMVKENGSKR